MKKIIVFSLILLVIFNFAGCNKKQESIIANTTVRIKKDKEPDKKTVLGKKLENPYAVKNMQIAYDNLIEKEEFKSFDFDKSDI